MILKEAITNVVKHSDAEKVLRAERIGGTIDITNEDGYSVIVRL